MRQLRVYNNLQAQLLVGTKSFVHKPAAYPVQKEEIWKYKVLKVWT